MNWQKIVTVLHEVILSNVLWAALYVVGCSTFHTPVTYSVGGNPTSVAAVDVNGDGKPDIIVANELSNNVGVLLNIGNGTFAAQVTYTAGYYPISVAVADINGDGKLDIITANEVSGSVVVLIQC